MDKVRLDKWLWAARFFKTRTLAKDAIAGGKVKVNGQRAKPSRDIGVGMRLDIQVGWDTREVDVLALSDQRRGAPEAALLYRETDASLQARESRAEARRLVKEHETHPGQRPTKRQRRMIHQFLDTPD
ncbi:MAG: S4 domain-containing protein [Porticoccaceae bacterium]|jgi:ribosome-associated heat shock protein Hsp15|nr:S4 domain-containing protein [Porticoccaceae bacterium]MEA3299572.1 S4 domain-containing protein [Pseudomonadota bacterium]HLS97136.1 S4 domain-containing protein [Porticoccaceae bacterium]